MGGALTFSSEENFTGEEARMGVAWPHRLAGALMSHSTLLRANVNSDRAADESMQSFPSQQGSGDGFDWGLGFAVPMASSCSIAGFSQQEGRTGAGLCMSQSGGQNACAAAAGPSKPTATTTSEIRKYRPRSDSFGKNWSAIRALYYIVAGPVKSVEKHDQIVRPDLIRQQPRTLRS